MGRNEKAAGKLAYFLVNSPRFTCLHIVEDSENSEVVNRGRKKNECGINYPSSQSQQRCNVDERAVRKQEKVSVIVYKNLPSSCNEKPFLNVHLSSLYTERPWCIDEVPQHVLIYTRPREILPRRGNSTWYFWVVLWLPTRWKVQRRSSSSCCFHCEAGSDL